MEGAAPGAGDLGLFGTGTVVNPIIDTSQSILGLYYSGTSAYSLTAGGGTGTKTLTILGSGIVNDSSAQQSFASGSRTLAITVGASTAFTANGTGSLYFNSNMGNISIGNNFTLTLSGNSSTSSTIAEVITDSSNNGKLTKSGSGTWVLSANSSYGGATTISDGILSLSNMANGGTSSHIGNSSNAAANLVFDGGTLRHTAAAADSTNRNFTITAGKTAIIDMSDAAGNLTISGAAAATTGGLTKIGAGTLTLSGNNAYTGATSIGTAGGVSGGTLTLGNNERISNSSTVNVYAGTFNVNSRTETISGLNLGGGAAGTTAAVTMTSGTLTLGDNLTYSATNDPNGATITGGTLALGANRIFTIGDSSAATNDLAISSVISGAAAGINKQGAGILQLSGTNTYTGVTTFTAGTLSVATIGNGGVAGNLGQATNAASNLVFNGGTLQYTGATASTNRAFTLTDATTGTIDVSTGGTNLTISGSTTATTGALTKTGAGTLTLTGTNLHSGTTTISAGTLSVGDGGTTGSLGSGNVVNNAALVVNRSNAITLAGDISGSGTLTQSGAGTTSLTGTNSYAGTTTISAGTLSVGSGGTTGTLGSGSVVNNAALVVNRSNAVTLAGDISGSGTLTQSGAGTTSLTGTNSYAGTTTISAGTLSVGSGGTTGSLGSGSVVNNAALVINRSNAVTLANDISGSGTLTQSGAGTTTLTGTNSYAGTTTISAGTLSVGSGGTTGTLGSGNVVNNAALVVNRSNAVTLAGDISGTGSLTQSGAGTTTLSGTNTYTGVTTLNAGALSVATIGNGGVAGNLGQATNGASNLVFNGGTLQYTGATASTDRGFTLNNATTGTIEVTSAAANLTISGSTTATTGALTKTGDGTLTLTGTNLHSGTTTVDAGTLKASGNNSLGDTTGNITVSAGASLALDGGTNITRSGTLTLNGTGTSGTVGALHAAGGTGTTSQWTGSTTINTASTITAADNLLIIGNGASGQFNTTTLTLNAGVTFHTPNAASVIPTYLPVPAYVMDPANIMLHSYITGTGGITKTGNGTLSIIRGTSFSPNDFTGDTVITGGTLLVDGPSNKSHLSSTNIYVGNTGSLNDDSVVLLMGEATGTSAGNNILGIYNAVTNASDSNLTVYEDGLFNMNRGSNGFINLTLQGGHVDGVGSNPLLTLSGSLFSKASAQTGLIENSNLGIGSNKLTVDVESGTTSSGVDLQIDSTIQQGVGFTAVASGTSLEKTDLGKVVLTGTNTYGGVTDIVGGTLNIQNANALGQNSVSFGSTNHGTTVQSGAQLQLQGGITVENETLTLSGTGVSTTGALRNFGGDNTYNGYVFLAADSRINADAGTNLILANPSGLGSAVINGTSAGKNLIVGGDGNTTVKGAIVGNVSNLTKDGNGTLTLAGSNSYVGATAVQAGALKITHNNGLSGTGVTVSAGAALQFAQNEANQNIAAVGIASTISGTGISNGGAIQNLTGANSYSGAITLADNSRITAASGSSLTLSGTVTGAGFALDAGGVGNTTYSGAINGSGTALTKTDSGTVTLSGASANTFTAGTNVNDGTLVLNKSGAGLNTATGTGTLTVGNGVGAADSAVVRLDASNQIADTAAVVLAADGRLNLNSFTDTVGSIAGSGEIIMGTGQLIAGGNNSSTLFDGTLHGASSAILNKEGTGTLTIGSNVNAVAGDFAGTINLNAGALAFNVDNAFTGTVNVAVSAGGTTLKLSDADVNINNLNFTGSGAITLDFSGTSSLSVTNLTIAAGVTVNIINWTDATDYFFATNWSGATQDLTGQAPMNYVVFQGWVGDNTKWQSYDDQITPVPEPSTYGAMLVGAMGAFLGWRRYRRNKSGAAK